MGGISMKNKKNIPDINQYLFLLDKFIEKNIGRSELDGPDRHIDKKPLLEHYCNKYKIYGERKRYSRDELASVAKVKFFEGYYRFFNRKKNTDVQTYVLATIRHSLRNFVKLQIRWDIHHKSFKDFQEPSYTPSYDYLTFSDFAFDTLSADEIRVLIYRSYGFSYEYICGVLGLSYSKVRQLNSRALKKMRANKRNMCLLN